MDTDGGGGGLGGGAPDVIHELQAGKYLVGVGEELVEQAKFLLGQDLLPALTLPQSSEHRRQQPLTALTKS